MRVCTRPTFRSQLCARSEVQCAESPFLSVHLCITYACNVLCATYCVQCSACNVLCAAFCVQRTVCSVLRAMYCVQRSACNVPRAMFCVQHTACNVPRAMFRVQCSACNVLRATYCVQRTVCKHSIIYGAKYLRTACRRVGTKPSPGAGYIYGCVFAQLCTQPFHSNFNFIRYRIFTTALLPTGNTYDSVTVSVIRYIHVPLSLIHCVVPGFTN